MALSLTVTKRRPQRHIDEPAQSVLGEPRNPKLMTLDNVIVEPLSKCMMLSPIYAPENYEWGYDAYTYTGTGVTSDDFMTLDYVFGRAGKHVMRREVNSTTAWSARLSSSLPIAAFRGTYINFFWWRPPSSVEAPNFDIFPRVCLGVNHPTGGGTFSPFGLRIDGDNNLNVYESQHRTVAEWQADPTGYTMPLVYSHALESRERVIGPYNRWLTMWVQPLDTTKFLVKADWLTDGGFIFTSDVEREYDLFPEGSAGINMASGGGAMWQITPCEYETSGTAISQPNTRLVPSVTYPDISTEKYDGADTSVAVTLLDDEDVLIADGDMIESWKYDAALTGLGTDTPRVFRVNVEWDATLTALEAEEVDVSANVMDIQVNLSADNHGREGTLVLRNPGTPGDYDSWVIDPLLEFNINLHGEDLMVAFGENPSFDLYKIGSDTDRAVPIVSWEIGDAWRQVQQAIVKDSPDYADMALSAAITKALKGAGWRTADLDIDECTFKIPKTDYGDKATSRAAEGIRLSEQLSRWQEDYARTWDLSVTRAGVIQFKEPGAITIARTFYMSRTQGAAAYVAAVAKYDDEGGDEPVEGDYAYYVEKGLRIGVNTRDYRNEIWVVGFDPRKSRSLVAVFMDPRSMKDPTYENYVGQRRLLIYANSELNRQDAVNWVLAEWKKFYATLRKQTTFRARLDPLLLPGDYVMIEGLTPTWKIQHISIPVARGNVAPRVDQTVHVDYSVVEWPTADDEVT